MAGGMHGMCVWHGGMHGSGGYAWQGACVTGDTATAADGTHPTGMHSCLCNAKNPRLVNYCLYNVVCL